MTGARAAVGTRGAPRIVVTQGDPEGIGPEVLVAALSRFEGAAEFTVLAQPETLRRACEAVDAPMPSRVVPAPEPGAASALWALEEAARRLGDGAADAIVTAPIHKADLVRIGFAFPGQTEFFGARLGDVDTTMMLAGESLRVALVTTHLPLVQVPDAITTERVETTIRRVDRSLRSGFGIELPRIAVLGLNPHAGEDGVFGTEDGERIAPAVAACREDGIACEGPLPGDGTFTPRARARFDAFVAMYHDQGLAALKAVEGGEAVNVTLGLPAPRTSPDHGTARDIAGKGLADPISMLRAVELAVRLCG